MDTFGLAWTSWTLWTPHASFVLRNRIKKNKKIMNITNEQFTMSLDARFKSTTVELPKKEGTYLCIIPQKDALSYCKYKDGFFQQEQNFEYYTTITRYRVSFWIEIELYEEYKKEKK